MAFLEELKQHLPMMAMMGIAGSAPQSSGVAQQGLQALMQSDKMGLLRSKLQKEETEITAKAEMDKQAELAFKYLLKNRDSGRDKNELVSELQTIAPTLFQSKEGMQRFSEAWKMIMGQKEKAEEKETTRHQGLMDSMLKGQIMTGEQMYPAAGGYIPEGTGGETVKGTTFYPKPEMSFTQQKEIEAATKARYEKPEKRQIWDAKRNIYVWSDTGEPVKPGPESLEVFEAKEKIKAKLQKPEITEAKAVDKIAMIDKAINNIEQTGGLGSIFFELKVLMPDLAKKIKTDPKDKAIATLKTQKQYYLDKIPDETKKKYGFSGEKSSPTGITHKFVPGKGLVPVR